ncbi:glycoside hydrolase family 2 TIM barrel-domain containing protein [Maribacter sp. 2304DJ31-5]|uniref:glycoside hydrolase family 2 TIM barrel-domain containing protein n=1 Tax=Maribacter sp. 2304DJ31-5 TaxID=3386273 RepID=UPI0039BCD9E5
MRFPQVLFLVIGILFQLFFVHGQEQPPKFSTAGFYPLENTGRAVFDFNVGWRYYKGAMKGAESVSFDDSSWEVVSVPHGLELNSTESSGGENYQGEAWYRKHFTIPESLEGKKLSLHFEAVMGKCNIWLNGELVGSHFGGFLPFSIDITEKIKKGEENILAVWADNSDDASYPPGKPQRTLDFTYFGGIYRDVWLIATNPVFITNANTVDEVAGGGILVHVEKFAKERSVLGIAAHVSNTGKRIIKGKVQYLLKDKDANVVAKYESKVTTIGPSNSSVIKGRLAVDRPELWSPFNPYLYDLEIRVLDGKKVVDGLKQRVGIRKIEFKGKEGLFLNGEPYPGKLIGANRHQDHAYIGNALPNTGQWRDALILKQAGSDVIRAAHYPADPAFMDACDALGLFFIEATPGWQFWNEAPVFEQRVYQDIRNMVRRDRNHASVLMWEPILNETWYPPHFAKNTHDIVHEEYPFQGAYTVCDIGARGQEHFDVVYSHPFINEHYQHVRQDTPENRDKLFIDYNSEERSVFTREWGDCVDDWNSHNSPSRVSREWGERPQLLQAKHYAHPDYVYTSWETLHSTPRQHVGGALWHSFDHQRGYHPDPFYGGITDVFRQPKYSYYLFKSQLDPSESEPMVFIANEMTPFSSSDIAVYTNCEEVRLILYGKDTLVQKANPGNKAKMPHPIVVFKDVYDFIDVKNLHRDKKKEEASIVAEGLIDGKVVATYRRMAALRPEKIKLELMDHGVPFLANGSDVVTVVASITDASGNVKRLNNSQVKFEIEGEGNIIDDGTINANPRKIEWGTAPVLIGSTTNPGKITIKASLVNDGINRVVGGELTFESIAAPLKMLHTEQPQKSQNVPIGVTKKDPKRNLRTEQLQKKLETLERELQRFKLKEVERQQKEFEGTKKNRK